MAQDHRSASSARSARPPATILDRLAAGAGRAARITHTEHLPPRAGRHADLAGAHPAGSRSPRSRRPESTAPGRTRQLAAEHAPRRRIGGHRHRNGVRQVARPTWPRSSAPCWTAPRPRTAAGPPRSTSRRPRPWPPTSGGPVSELAAPLGTAVRPAVYDGDTPFEEREWVRQYATYVLTNPDMLHRGILPAHARWASFLRALRYVVIDECHTYRGVFGSHVAQVLRRLRRVCARYGADPVFLLASATAADPPVAAGRLTGRAGRRGHRRRLAARRTGLRPVGAAADRAARRARRPGPPHRHRRDRRPAHRPGRPGRPHGRLRTLPARRRARRADRPGAARRGRPLAARPGRRLPRRLPARGAPRPGARPALRPSCSASPPPPRWSSASTSPAWTPSLLAGYPGTRASLWQQAGRAGRGRPGRAGRPGRPRRPAGHLPRPPPRGALPTSRSSPPSSTRTTRTSSPRTCAPPPPSSRSPTTTWRSSAPRPPGAAAAAGAARAAAPPRRRLVLDPPGAGRRPHRHPRRGRHVRSRSSRRRPGGCWARSTPSAAHTAVHDGAVHLHQGRTYLVRQLDLDDSVALVERGRPAVLHDGPRHHRHHRPRRPTPRSPGARPASASARSRSPTRSSPSCAAG